MVGALFAFALVLGAYFVFRFGGRWSESDTATLAITVGAMASEATLTPASGAFYSNGYVFGAVSTFILAFTGLETATLFQLVYPLVSASLVVPAWVLYRELTGSTRGATLATLILFSQPEFVFVVLRGSHERVLRVLLFASLFLLVRSVRFIDRPRAYTVYVLLFYLTVYGLIATNAFFGSSYVFALGLALVGSWFAAYLGPNLSPVSLSARRRLLVAPLVCLLLVFLFNNYIYPVAGRVASQVPDIFDRLYRLFLTASPDTTSSAIVEHDPYAAVAAQWIDIKVYFALSTGTFLLILASVAIWARMGLRWLSGSGARPTLGQWILWLCYGAFALQGALSIVADRTGAFGGNLQHRSFPSFVMVAAPLVATFLVTWRPSPRIQRAAAAGLGLLAVLAIVKATNEPMVSNKWTFYAPYELAAMSFAAKYQDGPVWWEFDERLSVAQVMGLQQRAGGRGGSWSSTLDTVLITDITRLRSARFGRPLPPVGGDLRVYDNGASQIYQLRPPARAPVAGGSG